MFFILRVWLLFFLFFVICAIVLDRINFFIILINCLWGKIIIFFVNKVFIKWLRDIYFLIDNLEVVL